MLRLDVSGIRMASWSIRMCSLVDYQLKKKHMRFFFNLQGKRIYPPPSSGSVNSEMKLFRIMLVYEYNSP